MHRYAVRYNNSITTNTWFFTARNAGHAAEKFRQFSNFPIISIKRARGQ